MRRFLMGMLLMGIATELAACDANNPTYFPPPMGPLEVNNVGQQASATIAVDVPIRRPSTGERTSLQQEAKDLGFGAPWLRRDDFALSIEYSITNLGKDSGEAQVLVNGSNEYTNYDLAALQALAAMQVMNNNDVVLLSLITGTPVKLAPGETRSGVIREDEFEEAELDLDAIGRWMAPPAAVLINNSQVNPVGLEKVPVNVVVPALFKVAVTFTATVHMRMDFLVRVRDKRGRLLSGSGNVFSPRVTTYAPPVAAPVMMN